MSKSHQISSDFWIDDYTANIDPTEKLLFLYLLTNPHANIAGVYQLPLKAMASDTGIELDMLRVILNRFVKDEKILYKDGWVAIKNRSKFNKLDNPNIQKGITDILLKAPDFIRTFLEAESLSKPLEGYPKSHIDIDKDIDIDISSFVEKWNRFAKENGLSECLKITAKRRTAFISKRDDINKNIDKILEKIKESDFLLGKNDRGWKVTLDFLLDRKDSLIKILEGGYNGKARGSAKQSFIDAIGSGDFGVPAHKRG